ncbi:MAG: hypothetical protein ACTSXL_01500 [Alphaproteobacteria bacterium]
MKITLISFLLFLSACSSVETLFFGEMENKKKTTFSQKEDQKTTKIKIQESNLEKDYFGFPILEVLQNKSKTKIENSTYYAIKTSFARTKKHHYRIVGWENKAGQTKKNVERIKEEMILIGVPEKEIFTHFYKTKNTPKVRIYER